MVWESDSASSNTSPSYMAGRYSARGRAAANLRCAFAQAPEAPRGAGHELQRGGSTNMSVVKPVRILVADDNCDAADAMCRLLRHEGHEVRASYDSST
jgi:PleD family two-component response regulator